MTDYDIAVKIAEKVKDKGGETYFVGGYVRDKIMGIDNKDIDIEIHGLTSTQVETILDDVGNEIGSSRMEYGKSFGIYSMTGFDIDIALPRTERCVGDTHRSFVVTFDPMMGTYEASKRRDFTMNALMENVLTGEIIDHFGGQEDIKNHIIRHIDDKTFIEDPLRVLRAAQFAARFYCEIDPKTIELCKKVDISTLPAERIFMELQKALTKSKQPSIFFYSLLKMDHLGYWFPEVYNLIGIPENQKYHTVGGDTFKHTMLTIDYCSIAYGEHSEPTIGFMLSGLCHDFGKAVSTTVDENGVVHAINHEHDGLPLVETFLKRLKVGNLLTKMILNTVKLHMLPHQLYFANSSKKKTNRMFDEAEMKEFLIYLAWADSKAAGYDVDYCIDEFAWLDGRLYTYLSTMSHKYVTGQDLIDNGLQPSKDFHKILEYAHKLRLAGLRYKDQLRQTLGYAKTIINEKEND
jgi:tRNA nucleotidyltransferase (CCA-adding enzyme)